MKKQSTEYVLPLVVIFVLSVKRQYTPSECLTVEINTTRESSIDNVQDKVSLQSTKDKLNLADQLQITKWRY